MASEIVLSAYIGLGGFTEQSGRSQAQAEGQASPRIISAIEILRKLSDESWKKKLQTFGYVEQVYDSFRAAKAGDGDRVRLAS